MEQPFKRFSSSELLALQKDQYSQKLLVGGVCLAGRETVLKTSISSMGGFMSQFVTGSFTTLQKNQSDEIVDFGINSLRIKIEDGGSQLELFNDYVPADIFFSPARVRDALATNNATTAPAPSNLFYPYQFEHLFAVNSTIILRVINDGEVDQKLNVLFHGIRKTTND